jgi:uncharacterized membrane protein YphA (DoxX/SURF4 family)
MEPVLTSILFLTLLLVIGLAFFIRASTKDRTETVIFSAPIETVGLLDQLQTYFEGRAYQVTSLNSDKSEVTFSGIVKASVALAIFLSTLAAVSLGCIALVLYILFPNSHPATLGILLLSPLAGFFYWKGAKRPETVKVTITDVEPASGLSQKSQPHFTHFKVSAHRDEIATLQSKMNLKPSSTAA